MPRHNTHQNPEKKTGGYCKTRKRVSSSSSSSSVVKNYRLKRAILVGKRVGSSTPIPTWKVIMAGGSRSPLPKLQDFENEVKYGKDNNCGNNKGKEALSARKLAATLWEINGLRSPCGDNSVRLENFEEKRERERGRKSSGKFGKIFDSGQHLFLDQNPHSPVCEKIDGSKVGGHRRRSSATSQKLQITEYIAGGLDTVGKASSIEVASHVPGEINFSVKTRLKDVNNSLIASKELVKVLFRILSQEEQNSSRMTLVSALRVELDRARLQIDQLIQEQRSNSHQIDALLSQFAEEKAAWKIKEKERIREAISCLTREVEIEKKLRKQAERLNKKLGIELANTRAHFSRALKELDGERRAREILEQTCDELARGIGEERVEVEELIRESQKVREEVEKERQMLQMADVLREERVQMKLAEARYEFEEKNAALEKLKNEIENHFKNEGKEKSEIEDDDDEEEDSGDSELHSIELNMENNNKSYKWNFTCDGSNQNDSRITSIDEVFKGRKSISEKIQWENICLERKTSDSIEWDFTANKQANVNGINGEGNEHENEFRRYKAIKSQRLPSPSPCQGSVSPSMSSGKSSRLREACSAILQDLASRREQIEGPCLTNKR